MASKELMAASSRPMVLSILSEKESYGYDIIRRVKELSGGKSLGRRGCSTLCSTDWSQTD